MLAASGAQPALIFSSRGFAGLFSHPVGLTTWGAAPQLRPTAGLWPSLHRTLTRATGPPEPARRAGCRRRCARWGAGWAQQAAGTGRSLPLGPLATGPTHFTPHCQKRPLPPYLRSPRFHLISARLEQAPFAGSPCRQRACPWCHDSSSILKMAKTEQSFHTSWLHLPSPACRATSRRPLGAPRPRGRRPPGRWTRA